MSTIYRGEDLPQTPVRPHTNQPTALCCGSHVPHVSHGDCLGMTVDQYAQAAVLDDFLNGNLPDGAVLIVGSVIPASEIECDPDCGCQQ